MSVRTRARSKFLAAYEELRADVPDAYAYNFEPFVETLASGTLRAIYTISLRLGALVQSPAFQDHLVGEFPPERAAHIRTANSYRNRLVDYLEATGTLTKDYVAKRVVEDLPDGVREPQASHMLGINQSTHRQVLLLPDKFGLASERQGTLLVMDGETFFYREFAAPDGTVENVFRQPTLDEGRLFADADRQALSPEQTNEALARYAGAAVLLG